MGLRKEVLHPPLDIRALNEGLEDLGHGVGDERILDGAAISITKLRRKPLGELTIQNAETLVRHALGEVPVEVSICMTGPGQIWLITGRTDDQRLYLQADAADRTALVVVSS